MKTSSSFGLVLVVAATFLGSARAQQSAGDTLYFNNNAGGDGIWQNGAGGTTWLDSKTSANTNWDNTIQTFGVFRNAPGSVTVNGTVNVNNLTFNSNYTLTGGTIEKNGDLNSGGGTDSNVVTVQNNSNVTINSDIVIDTTQATDQYDINNSGTGTVTYNGDISFVGTGHPSSSVLIDNAAAGSTTILNGSFTNALSDRTTSIWIRGGAGTLVLNGDYSNLITSATNGAFLAVQSGTAILGTSKTGTAAISLQGSPTIPTQVYTSGAQTIANSIVVQNLNLGTAVPGMSTIGGSTADVSTYSGNISVVVSGLTLTAAANGQVNFTGVLSNNISTGLVKTGAGTVKLSGANTYGLQYYANKFPNGTVAADLQQGTTLIANTTGSAFGTNTGTVNIESGAVLGGSGISTEQVVSMAADSVIAPGVGALTPTTLHLNGGLTEENGLTMNFSLSGDSSDRIDFGGGNMLLDGQLTINLSGTPTVDDANAGKFILLSNYGFGSAGDPTAFIVNAPAGYVVTHSGVNNDIPGLGNYYYVDLAVAPEPSTYALLLIGGVGLVFLARRRRILG